MNEISQNLGLHSPSITLYAFHLRNSANQGFALTVPEASQLWEQLVGFGNKLQISGLQTLQQQLICYENDQYFPEAEDRLKSEYCILLRNQEPSLNFQFSQFDRLQLEGLLCPFRLHDTYAIDLTLFSKDTLILSQLSQLNPQNLLLPPHIHASLGQTILIFGQPIEPQENYQALADACVAQILLKGNSTDLVATGSLLGNPIFEYENRRTDSATKLHILVWFKCQSMSPNHMDIVAELLLYLLWCRHKINYVYHESRWCHQEAEKIRIITEQYARSFHQLTGMPNWLQQLKELLFNIPLMSVEYTNYLRDIKAHQNTISINSLNYKNLTTKFQTLHENDLDFLQKFIDCVDNQLLWQIQEDQNFLILGRDLFQLLTDTVLGFVAIEQVEITQKYGNPVNNDMLGIPTEIYNRLYKALLNCEQFDSAQRLRNFFKANAPLTPWQHHWQVGSPSELVEDAISYLNDKVRSDTKENALVILVRLLAELIDPADSRHQTLAGLAQELETFLVLSSSDKPDN